MIFSGARGAGRPLISQRENRQAAPGSRWPRAGSAADLGYRFGAAVSATSDVKATRSERVRIVKALRVTT